MICLTTRLMVKWRKLSEPTTLGGICMTLLIWMVFGAYTDVAFDQPVCA